MKKLFAKRADWDLGENPLSIELERLRTQGAQIYDLTESNPTRCGFDYPQDVFLEPLSRPENLVYAPHPKGMPSARQAVADYYARKGLKVAADDLLLTSSTSEAYTFLFRLFMNPGERILIPAPSYPLFSYLAGLNDVESDFYQIHFKDHAWRMDFDSIERAITAETKAIILVSPNNPTGSCIKREELAKLNSLCRRHNIVIICDEVFSDFIYEQNSEILSTLVNNSEVPTFVLGGVSKAVAIPQMKLSWIAVNGPSAFKHQCLERLELIADTYLSVNTPSQRASSTWLANAGLIQTQIAERVRCNYQTLAKEVSSSGFATLFPLEGGWYAVLKASLGMPEDEWAEALLKDQETYVHPGFFFDFAEEGYLVVSLLPESRLFNEGVRRMCFFAGR